MSAAHDLPPALELATDCSHAARAGRDSILPDWLDRRATPHFDSVVIRGSGVAAMTTAARLARSDAFADHVLVAGSRSAESPRLVNGCTLRARSLDYLAAALGESQDRILEALFGERAEEACTRRQFFSIFHEQGASYSAARMAEFMPSRTGGPSYAYGLRNGRLVHVLGEAAEARGARWTDATEPSIAECRDLALGRQPFVVNGSHTSPTDAPEGEGPAAFVAAWQTTMKRRPGAALPRDGSLIAGVKRKTGLDIGVFYPFADPLTPEADGYGLFYRIVRPDAKASKEESLAEMRATVIGVGKAIGWDVVDEGEAAAGAQVPGFAWRDVPAPVPDYFDLHRTFSAGLPIITGCGMARAGLAGWLTAESLIHGEAPAPVVNRSLRRWRRLNREFCLGMEDRTGLAAAALRRFPARLVGLLADRPDVWSRAL